MKIGCIYDTSSTHAKSAFEHLNKKYNLIHYNDINNQNTDVIITIGGDGVMLKALHKFKNLEAPIYGINRGSIGFLLNEYNPDNLLTLISNAEIVKLYPLKMTAKTEDGCFFEAHAFNEVSLLREINQIAKIKVEIDNITRLKTIYADGIIVSTPAGSTAYNFAAHGPIIPIDSNILALTPISPFRPRRWNGALISNKSFIKLSILDSKKRPVSAVADSTEVRNVVTILVKLDFQMEKQILFDKGTHLRERIINEQFNI